METSDPDEDFQSFNFQDENDDAGSLFDGDDDDDNLSLGLDPGFRSRMKLKRGRKKAVYSCSEEYLIARGIKPRNRRYTRIQDRVQPSGPTARPE